MEHWELDDRTAFSQAVARDNTDAMRPWTVVASALALALVMVTIGLAPASVGVPYGPAVVLVAVAVGALIMARLREVFSDAFIGPLSMGLVVATGLVLAWVLLSAPAAVALVAGAFILVSLAAGLLFTWDLAMAVPVQLTLVIAWLLGVSFGPGWGADAGQLAACTALVVGASTVSLVAQRTRREHWTAHFFQLREAQKAAETIDQVRAEQRELQKDRDQLFSDVTNGLREPVVRLLRAVREQMDMDESAVERLGDTWRKGLRLLHKLDDLGILGLHQRGHLRLRLQRVQLSEVVAAFVEQVRPSLEQAGVLLDVVEEDVPDNIHVDGERLERILVVMMAEMLRRCPEDADIQVEVGTAEGVGGQPMAQVEIWCDGPDRNIDRSNLDDFWKEPEGDPVESRLARALAAFHGGRLVTADPKTGMLSWKLQLRTGTQHLTDDIIDRRVKRVDSDRGRRFEDRDGMSWAAELSRTADYRFLEVSILAEVIRDELG